VADQNEFVHGGMAWGRGRAICAEPGARPDILKLSGLQPTRIPVNFIVDNWMLIVGAGSGSMLLGP
jgi:hypothetical protein